jgi:tRNA pseudouridine38-40 synthase
MEPAPGKRYRLTVAYSGGAFAGWQRQPNASTVQELLEDALAELTGERVALTGAGRTDAGVHAAGQVAHFDLSRPFALGGLVHGTNHRLPGDIRVLDAAEAAPDFHARFSAEAKEYRYRWIRARFAAPRDAGRALAVPEALDLAALVSATRHLPGPHDFSAFALAGGAHTSGVRTLFAAGWIDEPPLLELRLVGDGFLRGMVRGIAGTLLDVALGRRSPTAFAALLGGGSRDAAGATAPAHGLTLERVWFRHNSAAIAAVNSSE